MCMKGKCGRKNEKSQLTEDPKMAYNKGTKKAVHSSEWRPKNLNSKIVTFAVVGG